MIHAGAFYNATTLCMSHVYSISYCQAIFNVDELPRTTDDVTNQIASAYVEAAATEAGYKPTQMRDHCMVPDAHSIEFRATHDCD